MVTGKALGALAGTLNKLLDVVDGLIDFFVGAPPQRKYTPGEVMTDPVARREHMRQQDAKEAAGRERGQAIDHMAEDIKAGKHLRIEHVRALALDDLENIRAHGDSHIHDLIRQREEEKRRERERQRGRER